MPNDHDAPASVGLHPKRASTPLLSSRGTHGHDIRGRGSWRQGAAEASSLQGRSSQVLMTRWPKPNPAVKETERPDSGEALQELNAKLRQCSGSASAHSASRRRCLRDSAAARVC